MARRYYSSTAVATTLSGSANNSTTSISVTALSGYPVSTPWTAIIDPDTASEEVVEVTGVSGTTLTVTRGVDGTSGVSHSAGAVFRHGVSARDFDEPNKYVNTNYTAATTAPGSPTVGDRWFETDTGITYTYVSDGSSSQWVELSASGTGATGATGATGPTGADGPAGGVLARDVASAAVTTNGTTSPTTMTTYSIGAGTVTVGRTYRVQAKGYRTGSNNSGGTFAVSIGGQTVTTLTHSNTATSAGWSVDALVTIRSTGASGTAAGQSALLYNATWLTTSNNSTVTVDTTGAMTLSLIVTAGNSANSYIASQALIEQVN